MAWRLKQDMSLLSCTEHQVLRHLLGCTIDVMNSNQLKEADEQNRNGSTERIKHLQPVLAGPLTE